MIRRILSGFRVVAPPGWPVVLFLLVLAASEGPFLYIERQLGQPIPMPIRPGRWCLIGGAILLARYRVVAFHPYYQADYLRWLKSTPWTVHKPLPVGPVELVLQDAPAVGGLMLVGLVQPQTESIELLNTFLFAHLLWVVGTFWKTGVPGFGYVGLLLLGVVPRLWVSPWVALAVLAATYLAAHEGLWRALAGFPWATEGVESDRNPAARQEQEFGPACGWPYDRLLRDVKMARGIGRVDALLISMLVGWWAHALEGWITPRVQFPMIMFLLAQSVLINRGGLYFRGYAPPISLWGRIATFRWIIPGYDRALLVFPLAFLALPAVIMAGASLGIDPRRCTPVAAALMVFITLSTPPALRTWRLTGRHRLVPAIPTGSQDYVQVG